MRRADDQRTIFLHELYQRGKPGQGVQVTDITFPQGARRGLMLGSIANRQAGLAWHEQLGALTKGSARAVQYVIVPAWRRLRHWWGERLESWRWQREVTGRRRGVAELVTVFALALVVSYVGVNYQALVVRLGYWWAEPTRQAVAAELEERLLNKGTELKYIPRSTKLAAVAIPVAPSDHRLIVPRLDINVPIVDTVSLAEKQVMRDLEGGVVHLANTAAPGEVGNVFITGHSSYYPWAAGDYKTVFALLDKLQTGDNVILYRGGEKFLYRITGQRIVAPDDLTVLEQRGDQRKLTLMTCYPLGTNSKRLIIDAYQVLSETA